MAGKKKPTPIPLQSLDALFGTTSEEQAGIQQIALDNLHPFSNHPFKVLDDDKMAELSESVRTHGVLVPGIVRVKDTGGYEIIAGHRRKTIMNSRFEAGLRKKKFVSLPFFCAIKQAIQGESPFA